MTLAKRHALLRCLGVIALFCFVQAQDYLNFQPLPYHQGNAFYQQQNYQPSFPPHFRPFGFHQQAYRSPYKQYQPTIFPTFQNELSLRNHLPNPFSVDYPNFYQQFPQIDDQYQNLEEYNKVPAPQFREPIQLIPSRFPPRIENLVERIQNRFSIYNPGLIIPSGPVIPILLEEPSNSTAPPLLMRETPKPDTETVSTDASISSTDSPAGESESEASEDTTARQGSLDTLRKSLIEGESNPGNDEQEDTTLTNEDMEKTTESNEESTTESSTETTESAS